MGKTSLLKDKDLKIESKLKFNYTLFMRGTAKTKRLRKFKNMRMGLHHNSLLPGALSSLLYLPKPS